MPKHGSALTTTQCDLRTPGPPPCPARVHITSERRLNSPLKTSQKKPTTPTPRMFLNRTDEAGALYLAHRDDLIPPVNNKPWRQAILDDFTALRKAGLTNPS